VNIYLYSLAVLPPVIYTSLLSKEGGVGPRDDLHAVKKRNTPALAGDSKSISWAAHLVVQTLN
jgi:hypothetical protein